MPEVKPRAVTAPRTYRGGMDERRADEQQPEDENPTGGDENTEERLDADNPVEEDTLKTLDPDDAPA